MDLLTEELALDMPLNLGASLSGIATLESLCGGPETVDLGYALAGAKSAIVFGVPFDDSLIEPYLGKRDYSLSANKIRTTTFAAGIAFEISTVLTSLGYKTCPVAPNFAFRKDTPNGIFDRVPPASLKLIAASCGIGHIGQSGLLITKEFGAAFSLGAVITDAVLKPTEPLPEEENYCNRCMACKLACVADFINPEPVSIDMGGRSVRVGNCRLAARCAYPCGGITGLHPSGRWSTWSGGRFPMPEDDDEYRTISRKYVGRYLERKRSGAICYNPLLAGTYEMQYTCSNCQFVCHPDPEVRRSRLKTLRNSGVVVEDADGNKRGVPPKEAEAFLAGLPEERRRLYTDDS
ncbi:MAG: hypothetical protein LBS92_02415 [Candidatus Methanoplasma sp.]|jgi:epoxyqueuosine reductase QueG|nr:hypothetical protein [Candidatus Methanoplasma sp.]